MFKKLILWLVLGRFASGFQGFYQLEWDGLKAFDFCLYFNVDIHNFVFFEHIGHWVPVAIPGLEDVL